MVLKKDKKYGNSYHTSRTGGTCKLLKIKKAVWHKEVVEPFLTSHLGEETAVHSY